MSEELPLVKIEKISDSPEVHIGRNTVTYKCPYAQQYLPTDYVAISIGPEDKEICFDPKYFNDFLQQIITESKAHDSDDILYGEYDSECICCGNNGEGVIIDSNYYISCDLSSRSDSLSIHQEYSSHKEITTSFLCIECIEQIETHFPNDTIRSIVASQTL